MASIKRLIMKNTQYKIERKLSLLVVFFIFISLGVQAQTNLTSKLGLTTEKHYLTTLKGKKLKLRTITEKLHQAKADCFLITANYSAENFSSLGLNSNISFYKFSLNNKLFYEIGVLKNNKVDFRWYISRPTGISQINDKNSKLTYQIYDDLGVTGKFTFILGHYFTAIAVDDGETNFKLAPVFFGMDSNIGIFKSHMGEITGETDLKYEKKAKFKQKSKIWKMSGDAKIATLIAKLKEISGSIDNEKVANTKEAVLSVNEDENNLIKNLKLYPNPSDGTFNLGFSLKEESSVSFKIFNLSGQKVFEQNNNQFSKGNNKYVFDKAGKLSAGIYMVNITSDEFSKSMKLIIE